MGILDRLRGGRIEQERLPGRPAHRVGRDPGVLPAEDIEVVGESYRLSSFEALFSSVGWPLGGALMRDAVLVPEPKNPYDPNAVAVFLDGLHVGYVPTEDVARLQPIAMDLQRRGAPLQVRSRVWACREDDGWAARVTLSFTGTTEPEWRYVDRPSAPGTGGANSKERLTSSAQRRLMAEAEKAGQICGRDLESLRPDIAQARADGDHDQALAILADCAAAAERRAAVWLSTPASWPTEQTVVILRSRKDYAAEVAVLERYVEACPQGTGVKAMRDRLDRAMTLLAKSRGLPVPPPSPEMATTAVNVDLDERDWHRLHLDPMITVEIFELPVAAELVRESNYESAIRSVYADAGTCFGTSIETFATLQQHSREREGITAVAAYVRGRLVGYIGAIYAEPVSEVMNRLKKRAAVPSVRCRVYANDDPNWTCRITIGPYESVVTGTTDTQAAAEVRAQAEQLAQQRLERLAAGGATTLEQRGRLVRGKDYVEWAEPIKKLKRQGELEKALSVLQECVNAAEQDARRNGWQPAPWYTEQAAIILRKRGDVDGEIAVLERYVAACPRGRESPSMNERLIKARTRRRQV